MANSDENSERNALDEEKSEKNDLGESKVVVSKQANNDEAKSENDAGLIDDLDEDDDHLDTEIAQLAKHRLISIIPKNYNQDEDPHRHNQHRHHSLLDSNQSQHQNCHHRHNEHHHKPHHHHHNHHHHHHHNHHHHNEKAGHVKELIKPDPTIKAQIARSSNVKTPKSPKTCEKEARLRVATVVDEEQLHKRFVDQRSSSLQKLTHKSPSDRMRRSQSPKLSKSSSNLTNLKSDDCNQAATITMKEEAAPSDNSKVNSSKKSTSSSSDKSHSSSLGEKRSPPPNAIVIPSSVTKSLSSRALTDCSGSRESLSQQKPNSVINREQLEYGSLLKSGEVQMLYRSPNSDNLGVFLTPLLYSY